MSSTFFEGAARVRGLGWAMLEKAPNEASGVDVCLRLRFACESFLGGAGEALILVGAFGAVTLGVFGLVETVPLEVGFVTRNGLPSDETTFSVYPSRTAGFEEVGGGKVRSDIL